MARRSDRFITPPVVVTLVLVGGVVVLAVIAAVTYLTALDKDPDPMLRLVANVTAAVGSVGTFVVQLATRRTTTNVEQKTGQLEAAVSEHLDNLEARTALVGAPRPLPPVPTQPHPLMGTAPGPAWERRADQSARTRGTDGGRSEWPGAATTDQVPPVPEGTPRRHHRASTPRAVD